VCDDFYWCLVVEVLDLVFLIVLVDGVLFVMVEFVCFL